MARSFVKYASVALNTGLKRALDYGVLEEHAETVQEGTLVQVPLRGVLQTGVVVKLQDQSSVKRILPIKKVLSKEPLMTEKLFELAIWMSRYYQTALSQVLKLFFPKSVQKDMGHKKQQIVTRGKTKAEIRQYCVDQRSKKPKQVQLLDFILKIEKEILMTELIQESGCSRATTQALAKSGYLEISQTILDRNPLAKAEFFPSKPKILNEEQREALNKINKDLFSEQFKVNLLFGVTGSGKTEIYLQAIQRVLEMGKTSLMLVPEIALTTQTIEKFKGRFKEKIAILHHRLSPGERHDEWYAIRTGKAPIVIGARSAIFAPLSNVGLIIVDEEHEQSYKQTEEMPTYHARDLAVMRGKIHNACVVLGTATPSFESYQNTLKGKYDLIELKKRVQSKPLPTVRLIDMKREFEKAGGYTFFSDPLLTGLKKCYERGEQALLFLNRRGYHTSLLCEGCGEVVKCPHCEITLTFHLKVDRLCCHLCDHQQNPPRACPKCGDETIKFKGAGTEKVEQQLKKVFPFLRTLRMDADTTKHVGSYEKLYYAFRNHKADVLIGTQMISKGLHFPNVTLVGVLNCDNQLNMPDFRASEVSFQLLTQVAGRAGRGEGKGEVLIQTFNTQNPILEFAMSQNYLDFYKHEIPSRELFNFSPFTHLLKIAFKGKSEEKTLNFARQYAKYLQRSSRGSFEVQEPLPCGYPKIKEYYRFQILIKTSSVFKMGPHLIQVEKDLKKPSDIRVLIDVDPSSTFF